MNLPANVQSSTVNVTTNATANTETDSQLLAAPGAGLRYRVWKMTCIVNQNAAAQQCRVYLREGTTTLFRAVCVFSVGVTGLIDLAAHGGLFLATNNAAQAATFSTLTSQAFAIIIDYTTESA